MLCKWGVWLSLGFNIFFSFRALKSCHIDTATVLQQGMLTCDKIEYFHLAYNVTLNSQIDLSEGIRTSKTTRNFYLTLHKGSQLGA